MHACLVCTYARHAYIQHTNPDLSNFRLTLFAFGSIGGGDIMIMVAPGNRFPMI